MTAWASGSVSTGMFAPPVSLAIAHNTYNLILNKKFPVNTNFISKKKKSISSYSRWINNKYMFKECQVQELPNH